ncbi:MAG: DNA mismatch repair protein MutS [Vicinamibacterales bacterium]|nr:DNA mismatch repair protein MutS [Vicinamibacterales bacterium]
MSRPLEHAPPLPAEGATVTPAMRQYLDAKRAHPSALVFFRMGDFYEMFYEDALVAARALDLTLTSRSKDPTGASIPMCGVPFHAADGYIGRLVSKGYRVAVCEQVEDPKKAKGVVKREVVRVVSPGTLTDAAYLDAREPAFLMAVSGLDGGDDAVVGAAVLDLSTGEFSVGEYRGRAGLQALADDVAVIRPREIVAPAGVDVRAAIPGVAQAEIPLTALEGWQFDYASARQTLLDQLRVHGLEGFGLDGHEPAVAACGALIRYLRDTQKADLLHVRTLRVRTSADALLVDPTTLKHLEVVESVSGGRAGSLLHEIDRTSTAMGGRLLRAWLLRPLVSLEAIRERLDAVEEFAFRTTERGKLRDTLRTVQDLERLASRVALSTAGPRDLVALKQSLAAAPRVKMLLAECEAPLVRSLLASLDELADVRGWIEQAVVDEPPALARDGGSLRDGVDAELDDLRHISRSGKQLIAEMEEAERARTGIASLKVRFNRVFGYYIEISKANLHLVPDDYLRKQTIAGGERFITPALKDYEEKVLGADERILERELTLFEALRQRVAAESSRVLDTARAIASLDVLAGLAETAAVANFTKPHVHEGDELVASDVRHPVVERLAGGAFVPNDVSLDGTARQLVILTGPNMGGKSTYLRQVALLSLLAQSGSFVPAREAKLSLVDRIYARVGASDNIARGQSTFMVEMQETAHILNGATSRSLVVLDEIGRGTATFDGLSIAWAVAEHLATSAVARPKTLFATHYHELTDLADGVEGVVNHHVAAREWQDDIIFLHKILPGRSDRSYGIQVARLAGLPPSVIARARAILGALETDELSRGGRPALSGAPAAAPQQQLGLFQTVVDDRFRDRLRALDIDQTTPLEALRLLAELRREATEE